MRTIHSILLMSLTLPACGGMEDHSEHLAGYEDTVLEGDVTDETLVSFVSALEAGAPVTSADRAPTLLEPVEGEELAGDTPPTFNWQVGAAARPLHGDPYTGYATYLELRGEGDEPGLQVFTSETSYTPAQNLWNDLVSGGGTFTVELIGADFEANRLAQDGGPFAGSAISFQVAP